MISFINSTKLEKLKFDTVVENIFLHTCLIQSEYGTILNYIEKIEDIEKGGIYIIEDKKLSDGIITEMKSREKYFIPNEIFQSEANEKNLFIEKDGAFICSFDLISFIKCLVYNKVSLHNKNLFLKYQNYQRFPFAEYLLEKFASDLKNIIIEKKLEYAEKQLNKNSYFLPTFDYDRIKYFKTKKDIFYPILDILYHPDYTKKYIHLRKKLKKDPWDRKKEIACVLKSKGLFGLHFVFVEGRDIFTSRYSMKEAREIISQISEGSNAGVHLTYESSYSRHAMNRQIAKFKSFEKKNVYSRFHYLHPMNEKIIAVFSNNNIIADFSVGLRQRIGFANGFSKPYRLFPNGTLEFPVIMMDSAIVSERKKENYPMKKIFEEVKLMGGVMSTIFHPSSLDENTYPEYEGILSEMISLAEKYKFENSRIESLTKLFSKKVLKKEDEHLLLDKDGKSDIKLYNQNDDFKLKE